MNLLRPIGKFWQSGILIIFFTLGTGSSHAAPAPAPGVTTCRGYFEVRTGTTKVPFTLDVRCSKLLGALDQCRCDVIPTDAVTSQNWIYCWPNYPVGKITNSARNYSANPTYCVGTKKITQTAPGGGTESSASFNGVDDELETELE